jgi:hypothetical protein
MKKEITIGDKKFIVRELLAIEVDDINWDDRKEAIKKQVMLSTGINEQEYNSLTRKERLHLINTINEINGLQDFQRPIN